MGECGLPNAKPERATSPTMGEALAAKLCVEMGVRKAVLEGDAKNVITTVLVNEPNDSIRGHITENIRAIMQDVPWW